MKTDFIRSLAPRMTCTALMLLSLGAHAAPTDFNGRGVFHFVSANGCPLDTAKQANADCNRIALDAPDAHAAVDTASHTIVFSSNAAPAGKAVIGDVLLQGSGMAQDGQRVPLSLHLLLRRSGETWSPDIYAHVPVRGKLTDVKMDPYQISVREGTAERVVFTPEQARDVFVHPSLAARLAKEFVDVRPTDAGNPSSDDITISLGVGKLSKSVARARFTSSEPDHADLNQILASGTWSIELEALSSHIPLWAVQRELFLFGLEGSPLLQDLRKQGFAAHDKLAFGALNGKGYLRFNGHEAAFDAAPASGRSFMQESFMGLILAWQRGPDAQAAFRATHPMDKSPI